MRYRILALASAMAALCLPFTIRAQAGFIPVYGAQLTDLNGVPANAQVCAQAVDINGKAVSLHVGGGGTTTTQQVCTNAASGVWSMNLPNTLTSSPANAGFSFTATDNTSGASLIGPGYSYVQPTSDPNSKWCTASGCDFGKLPPMSKPPVYATYLQGYAGKDGTNGKDGAVGCPVGTTACTGVIGTAPVGNQRIVAPSGTTLTTNSLNNVMYTTDDFPGADPFARLQSALDYVRMASINLPNSCYDNIHQCGIAAEIHVPMSSNGAEQPVSTPVTTGYYAGQTQRLKIVFDGNGCFRWNGTNAVAFVTLGNAEVQGLCLKGNVNNKLPLVYTGETASLHMHEANLEENDNGNVLAVAGSDGDNFENNHFRGRISMAPGVSMGYLPNANHFTHNNFDADFSAPSAIYGQIGQNNTWIANTFELTPMLNTQSSYGNVFSSNYGEGGLYGLGTFDAGWLIEGNILTYAQTGPVATMTLGVENTVIGNTNGSANAYLAHINTGSYNNVFVGNHLRNQLLVDPTTPAGSYVDLMNPRQPEAAASAASPTSISFDTGNGDGIPALLMGTTKCPVAGCQEWAALNGTMHHTTTTPGVGTIDQLRANGVRFERYHTPAQGETCVVGEVTQDATYDYKCDAANHWIRRAGGYTSF